MKVIVHISADFPDPLVPGKTKAVKSLLEAAPGFRHIVYSLNRVSWRSGVATRPFGEDHLAIAYGAPPYGVRLSHHLIQLADFIRDDMNRRGLIPDLIHAHKFTVEGMIAHRLSAATGRPYVASIWGGTDQRIFEAKPGLRSRFRAIARDAALLLPAAPWTGDYFADALQLDRSRMRLLPVITLADAVFPPVLCEAPRLLSVFAFDSWRRKGFALLVKAAPLAAKECPRLMLDIYGRGGPKALIDMDSLIRDAGGQDCITLKNAVDHEHVQTVMNGYAGFVLPSRVETYGMVFVEAVLAGVPILWSRKEAVDGLFNAAEVGYRCNPNSAEDVAAGLVHLVHNQARLKQSIAALQRAKVFEPLRREAIGALYRDILLFATSGQPQAASAA